MGRDAMERKVDSKLVAVFLNMNLRPLARVQRED